MTQYDYFTKFFDVDALLDIQRKNIQALSEIQKLVCESVQAVTQRQAELISQTVKESSSLINELMAEGTPAEKTALHADRAKHSYEKLVADLHLLTSMIGESGEEASNIINSRVVSSLTELKSAVEKSGKRSVQKKAA